MKIKRKLLRAYTLLEMMMALTILSILIAIGMPSLSSLFAHNEEHYLQQQLIRAIHFARHEARARQTAVGLYLNDATLSVVDIRNKQIITERKMSLKKNSIHYRSYPSYREFVLFSPEDITANDNGAFWFCTSRSPNPKWALVLSHAGRVRLLLPDSEGKIKSKNIALQC